MGKENKKKTNHSGTKNKKTGKKTTGTIRTGAHAGGSLGERDMVFQSAKANNRRVVFGPGGIGPEGKTGGKSLFHSGPDALMVDSNGPIKNRKIKVYIRGQTIYLYDNKASGGFKNIDDVSALKKNLGKSLDTTIKRVQNTAPFRGRDALIKRLKEARAHFKRTGKLPSDFRIVLTNAGGFAKGVTQNLMTALGKIDHPIFEDLSGKETRAAAAADKKKAGTTGSGRKSSIKATAEDAKAIDAANKKAIDKMNAQTAASTKASQGAARRKRERQRIIKNGRPKRAKPANVPETRNKAIDQTGTDADADRKSKPKPERKPLAERKRRRRRNKKQRENRKAKRRAERKANAAAKQKKPTAKKPRTSTRTAPTSTPKVRLRTRVFRAGFRIGTGLVVDLIIMHFIGKLFQWIEEKLFRRRYKKQKPRLDRAYKKQIASLQKEFELNPFRQYYVRQKVIIGMREFRHAGVAHQEDESLEFVYFFDPVVTPGPTWQIDQKYKATPANYKSHGLPKHIRESNGAMWSTYFKEIYDHSPIFKPFTRGERIAIAKKPASTFKPKSGALLDNKTLQDVNDYIKLARKHPDKLEKLIKPAIKLFGHELCAEGFDYLPGGRRPTKKKQETCKDTVGWIRYGNKLKKEKERKEARDKNKGSHPIDPPRTDESGIYFREDKQLMDYMRLAK